MGCLTGFEPATLGITTRYSNQLNYRHHREKLPHYKVKQTEYIKNTSIVKGKIQNFTDQILSKASHHILLGSQILVQDIHVQPCLESLR